VTVTGVTTNDYPPTAYATMLRAVATERPDAPALAFPGEVITYRELFERATWRARELLAVGVAAGDRFGVMLPNSSELVELIVAGAMIGATTVPVNTRYKDTELRHVCANGELTALFTTDALDAHTSLSGQLDRALDGLREASDPWNLDLAGFPHLRAVVVLGPVVRPGMLSAVEVRARAVETPAPTPADEPDPATPLLIMYTSGTTANAKGCVLTNQALVRAAQSAAERLEIPATDRWWDPLPMFHLGGILLMSAVFSRGGLFVSQSHFSPDVAFDLIAEHRPTVLYPLFPTITLTLLHDPRWAEVDTGSIRFVCNVSPPDVQRSVQAAIEPALLISAYGMTEIAGTLAYNALSDTYEQRTTTCGRPLPGWEIEIHDPDTNATLGPDEKGELVARGPALFSGYFASPDLTAASFDEAGFFHTGDHCSIDADGLLSFHGRLKDMLKVGGENVSALEVESFLATHPAVKLAQIVGVPDDRLLEVGAAFIELVPGATLTEDEVIDYCTGRIASFKIPRYVRFVTDWPMSSTKIQKFRLREQIVAELASPAASTA